MIEREKVELGKKKSSSGTIVERNVLPKEDLWSDDHWLDELMLEINTPKPWSVGPLTKELQLEEALEKRTGESGEIGGPPADLPGWGSKKGSDDLDRAHHRYARNKAV